MLALPAMPTQPAIAVCAPMRQLCADLDLVVELDVVLDHRVVDRAAVDRRVRADLAVGRRSTTRPTCGISQPPPAAPRPCRSRRRRSPRPRARSCARRSTQPDRRRRRVQSRASSPIATSSPMTQPGADDRARADARAARRSTAYGPIVASDRHRARRRDRRARRVDARRGRGGGCRIDATRAYVDVGIRRDELRQRRARRVAPA